MVFMTLDGIVLQEQWIWAIHDIGPITDRRTRSQKKLCILGDTLHACREAVLQTRFIPACWLINNKGSCWILLDCYCSVTMLRELGLRLVCRRVFMCTAL